MGLLLRIAARGMLVLAFAASLGQKVAAELLSGLCGECRPEKIATCGGFLEGLTVDPAGGLWVLDVTGDRILSVAESGQCVTRGKTGGRPNGAKFAKDGRLFIADAVRGILTFDPATSAIAVLVDSYDGKALAGANDLAIDEAGGVYFTVSAGSSLLNPSGRVFYLPPDAAAPVLLADKIAFPNGIAIGPGGQTILVAEFAAKRVLSLPPETPRPGFSLAQVYALTRGGVGPDGILVHGKGRLLAANFGTGEVLVWGSDGRPSGAIELPEEAGKLATNLVIRGKALFVTESAKGEIWRVLLDD